jgi:hypothetical protein
VNITELDVPLAVVMTTCADGPDICGTVTMHVFCAGQLVGATWPLKVATMWPLVLRKFAPATWIA